MGRLVFLSNTVTTNFTLVVGTGVTCFTISCRVTVLTIVFAVVPAPSTLNFSLFSVYPSRSAVSVYSLADGEERTKSKEPVVLAVEPDFGASATDSNFNFASSGSLDFSSTTLTVSFKGTITGAFFSSIRLTVLETIFSIVVAPSILTA